MYLTLLSIGMHLSMGQATAMQAMLDPVVCAPFSSLLAGCAQGHLVENRSPFPWRIRELTRQQTTTLRCDTVSVVVADSEEAFQDWVQTYPQGFVINAWKAPGGRTNNAMM